MIIGAPLAQLVCAGILISTSACLLTIREELTNNQQHRNNEIRFKRIELFLLGLIGTVWITSITTSDALGAIVSSTVISMPILYIAGIYKHRAAFINMNWNKPIIIFSAIHLLGYTLNALGISFGKEFTSSMASFRFSSFYGATTVSGLWALALAMMLLIVSRKRYLEKLMALLLVVFAQYSFQRSILIGSALIIVLYTAIRTARFLMTKEKTLSKQILTYATIALIAVTTMLLQSDRARVTAERIIERATTFTDSSQSQRTERHDMYIKDYKEGNWVDKITGKYPAIGNSRSPISKFSKPAKELYRLNPESYILKLMIEKGAIGVIIFVTLSALPIIEYCRALKSMIGITPGDMI